MTTKTEPSTKIIDIQSVTRDYGIPGSRAIIGTAKHGRLLIEDGFGGIDSLSGGTVSWRHGSAYRLHDDDTFESLAAESDYVCCGDRIDRLTAVIEQLDETRPYLHWDGVAVESIAKAAGLKS